MLKIMNSNLHIVSDEVTSQTSDYNLMNATTLKNTERGRIYMDLDLRFLDQFEVD